ncbi:hypothetical protein SAMN05518871_102407 [Psychrobacillus sp. OK028]|uniref:hypothetical protein n=1 Tax=Psychrobacillus sp. OK028 TaxID=1884359 RepID=UPI000888CEFB|nr:hypothetical protein [Psychrobacillus sp. OK028]SDM85708.1 hypothetical protein SAMN05518871_102407 [Psychrobacillus sp. OK028]
MISINKKTPFDRTRSDEPLLKILIHTDSIAKDLINKDRIIVSLLQMSYFPFLEIHFTPTLNAKILTVMSDFGVEPCKYCFYEDARSHVTLKHVNYESIISFHNSKDKLMREISDNSKVKVIDLFARNDEFYDYFIIAKDDGLYQSNSKQLTDVPPEEAIELIRILLVNLGYFYVVPRFKINEGYYYLYRFKKIFSEFQPAWSIVVSGQGCGISDEIMNQFDSLSQRLEFICRATDKVSYYSLKYANNDTQDNTLYHLGYLIMLITGAFDDLAWILTQIYELKLSKMEVVLKEPVKKTRFYEQLLEKNIKLHDFLTSDYTQNVIKMFYPIRDTLQHRQFVKGMKFSSNSGYENNVFALPKHTVDILKNITEDTKEYGLVFSHQDTFLFDSHVFVSKVTENFAYIVNNILALIDWERIIASLPLEIVEQIKDSHKKYEEGVSNFLGFGETPIYF